MAETAPDCEEHRRDAQGIKAYLPIRRIRRVGGLGVCATSEKVGNGALRSIWQVGSVTSDNI